MDGGIFHVLILQFMTDAKFLGECLTYIFDGGSGQQ